MTIKHFWHSKAGRHSLAWLLALGVLAAASSALPGHSFPRSLATMSIMLGLLVVPIYLHFWLLANLLERGRYGLYILGTVTVIVAGALLDAADHPLRVIIINTDEPAANYDLATFANAAFGTMLALLFTTALHYVRRGIISRYQMKELKSLQLTTELSLLKAQVNQHFLFNTLNNLYGLSLTAPDQMPEALLQLAGLMRYQLDSSRQRLVTVGTEAEYLANYIGLEKLRLRSNTQVEFLTDLPHPDQPLAPLLLLPLVENCFKHAIGPSGENTIRIALTQTDAGLTLRTDNSIPPHFRPAPSGLGLPTLRARLAQFYPGPRHQLTTETRETSYAAKLHLQL